MATQSLETAPPRRGRPPKVSPEAILDAVDRKRDGGWTMASIAVELGVSEPAIYYHFPSKQALLLALGLRALEDLQLPAPRDEWEPWLEEFAVDTLSFCRRHPFLCDLDMSRIAVQQTASVRVLEELLRYLTGVGFAPDDASFALVSLLLVVQAFAFAANDPDDDRSRLSAYAEAAGATLARDVYADEPLWDPDRGFRRMLRVALAGIRAELAPTGAEAHR